MTKKTIISLYCKGFCFCLNMLFLWHKRFVCFPVICTNFAIYFRFYFSPKFFACFCSSSANFAVDEFMPISINSNPDPTVVFFEPINVCISSNSTTSILSELLMSSNLEPNDFIQLKTETWLTFKNLPIERKPNPSRYSINASRLNLSGFPTFSTVKRKLHFLHLKRCLLLTIPSLQKFVDSHLGHCSINPIFIKLCSKDIKLY